MQQFAEAVFGLRTYKLFRAEESLGVGSHADYKAGIVVFSPGATIDHFCETLRRCREHECPRLMHDPCATDLVVD